MQRLIPAGCGGKRNIMINNSTTKKALAAIGIVLFLLRVPSATIGLGVYLPTYISSAMALGAVIMAAVKKAMKDKRKADETASLVSSGLLGGEGITGVIIAIFSMF